MNSLNRNRRFLAIGLAALGGYVDAVGFLEGGGLFVSFMSGNTTRLAVELAQGWRAAMAPAALIAGFVCGVALGAWLGERAGRWRKPTVTGLVAVLITAAALMRTTDTVATMALLVLAMGAVNNTFRREGEAPFGLTYMTGALVRLGQSLGLALAGRGRIGAGGHGWLWLGLTAGGVAGALVHGEAAGWALWLAAGACLVFSLWAYAVVRGDPA